ncbi:hypothetical protein N7491_006652, partial [Penicillium cf. griseofulvum]
KLLSPAARINGINEQAQPAADVAKIDEAQVPNILWGQMAGCLVARWRTEEADLEFVIPDHLIMTGSDALAAAGFTPCTDPECREVQTTGNDRPVAPVHCHVVSRYPRYEGLLVIRLYPKSGHLWWLPDFKVSPPAIDDPDLMLSNDPQLPPYIPGGCSGPWTEIYPIQILSPNSYAEAVLLLHFRDYKHANSYDNTWHFLLFPLMEYHINPELTVKRTLRPKFQAKWEEFNLPWKNLQNKFNPLLKLMKEMRDNNELPPPPPVNWYKTVEEAKKRDCWM